MRTVLFCTSVLLLPTLAQSAIWTVPGDYASIQQAVDAASDGDVIEVAAGVWDEAISVHKGIELRGAGADVCFVGARLRSGPEVHLQHDDIVVSGFHVTGGVYIRDSSPTFEQNIINGDLYAYRYPFAGGRATNPIIQNNIIYGGYRGVEANFGKPIIRNNFIFQHLHAGVYVSYYNFAVIENNTIANNGVAGVQTWAYSSPIVRNNIIAHNGRYGIANDYKAREVHNTYNVLFANQVADFAHGFSAPPVAADDTDILADPELIYVPRWSALSGYPRTNQFQWQDTTSIRWPGIIEDVYRSDILHVSGDDIPRVVTAIDGATVTFRPSTEHVPLATETQHWVLVNNLGHRLNLDFDWRITEGSIAIDAGDPDPVFNDVDGSRNDIGARGGPWSAWE